MRNGWRTGHAPDALQRDGKLAIYYRPELLSGRLGTGEPDRVDISLGPYPFILLNLVLSFQAAYATPIIMMSQNRHADKDRLAAEIDHQVNAKTELELGLVLRVHKCIISSSQPAAAGFVDVARAFTRWAGPPTS